MGDLASRRKVQQRVDWLVVLKLAGGLMLCQVSDRAEAGHGFEDFYAAGSDVNTVHRVVRLAVV